ncbi:endoplasmic reticulum vesicle transporter [Dunaliella salina]|uniref:Endoplasmic reticulum vesicle transporter n=1 Tax=Dunaliella salina TaxID=3046 RepID=A0ABQ7GZ85_DUNSA|nr:endoplasmic reticulum vesicle transporter [Dunaliella salina]|eukprot:KAF5839918.1 endoplasmic reticulum vesicle transporter [Dunaliella salina]
MLRVAPRSQSHSFDHSTLNMTHVVHSFTLGTRPSYKKFKQLKKLHPAGLQQDWADKLYGKTFVSDTSQSTHEHYLQIVLTTVEPDQGHKGTSYDAYKLCGKTFIVLTTVEPDQGHKGTSYDAYEYTAHSHTYQTDEMPSMRVTYDLSPIQILVNVVKKPWYHFLTTTCAIIGGVFTVAGIIDAALYTSMNVLKKVQIGKNS